MSVNVSKIFGENVFNEAVMQQRLPKEIYVSLKDTIANGTALEENVAQIVASAMRDWAVEKGATHFTHWFQPMTGSTAEKHDSFISSSVDGKVMMEFSAKELIKGEPDASSFPNGGLRATFEARGYTAWDPTSYAFVKDDSLYIPTTFYSYTGQVLDKKTPLLRSMEVVNKSSLRVLRALGDSDANHVISYVGPEQEYFLVDVNDYKARQDLVITGRTLFGAKSPKGQELDDHYFGTLKERVSNYMKEVEIELWKLGVQAKTKHNEVAPGQHELAPIYSNSNISTDHNQLTMDVMKKVAAHHGLVCLLHEKPFAGVNGSGKHNNWSLGTDTGKLLLAPGKNPIQNKSFLVFLSAVIKGVHKYGDLLRVSVATAGNDHRLGANEAPPAIVSIFLGAQLTNVLNAIDAGEDSIDTVVKKLESGVTAIPTFDKDNSDRNRTSPFAFTGNKFEFRMAGSSQNIAGINIVINTIVADALGEFADRLEKASDIDAEISAIVKDTLKDHKNVIFNGDNYSDEWTKEAEKRGLPNNRDTVAALPSFILDKNIELFSKHGIFSVEEQHARYDILLEDYSNAINIEALTMVDMAKKDILPAAVAYSNEVLSSLALKQSSGLSLSLDKQNEYAVKISGLTESLISSIEALEEKIISAKCDEDPLVTAKYYKDEVFAAMQTLRAVADELETVVSSEFWPFPTYATLLFNV